MKTRFLSVLAALCLFQLNAHAQSEGSGASITDPNSGATVTTGSATTNSTNATDVRTIPVTAPGTPPSTDYALNLQWNESKRGIELSFSNPSNTALSIQGIQSSGNIFVVSFPQSIAAGGTGLIEAVYLAEEGTQANSDLIRLLTSDGIKLLRIAHNRAQVVTLDKTVLSWQIGEALTPKSVTVTLGNGVQATGARSFDGSTATVTQAGTGIYLVTVTPGSTATADRFPVILTLSPAVPNTTPVIDCVIGNAN